MRVGFHVPRGLVARFFLTLLFWVFAGSHFATAQAEPVSYTTEEVSIPLAEGLRLKGEIYVPESLRRIGSQPAVLFLNPFGQTIATYEPQAKLFAEQGYVVLRYNPRGWHGSEGVNTLDYDRVSRDAQEVISWMIEHYGVTPGRIGVTGISEGAGLALLLSAIEPRLGAVAALSAWSDFAHPSLGNTQRATWSGILMGFLVAFGNPPKLFADLLKQLKEAPPGTSVGDIQKKNSPLRKLAAINAIGTPTLISHNFDDTLFPVNQMFDFYKGLTAPKRLVVFPGFHAASEISTIKQQDSGPWHEVKDWFAARLLNEGTMAASGMQFSLKNSTAVLEESGPEPADLQTSRYFLRKNEAGLWLNSEALESEPFAIHGRAFRGGHVSTGLPVLSALKNLQKRELVTVDLDKVKAPEGLVLLSDPIPEARVLFGIPRLALKVHAAPRGMLIAHLLDVPQEGHAQLITHGVITWTSAAADGTVQLSLEALGVAWQLKAGHRLGLAFDTVDAEYAPASLKDFWVNFGTEPGDLTLDVPWVRRPIR